jgi:hypothetical protein
LNFKWRLGYSFLSMARRVKLRRFSFRRLRGCSRGLLHICARGGECVDRFGFVVDWQSRALAGILRRKWLKLPANARVC